MARRVLTQEGADYFGVPIGQLITPDMEDDAKARHGGRAAPPKAVTGSNQKRADTKQAATGGNPAQQSSAPSGGDPEDTKTAAGAVNNGAVQPGAAPQAVDWASKGFIDSTISGPVEVLAGKKRYTAPEGSQVFQSPAHAGRAYVVTPDGNAHVFTAAGELNLTPEERQVLAPEIQGTLKAAEPGTEKEGSEEKGEGESNETVSWTKLVSIARHIKQAEDVGDEEKAAKLAREFAQALSKFDGEADPKKVREQIKSTTNQK